MSGGLEPDARIRVLHVDDDPSHQTMLRIFGETYDPKMEIVATDCIDDVFDHIKRGG
ncbi:unnamed protein product, partial [marine sediment metagenome]